MDLIQNVIVLFLIIIVEFNVSTSAFLCTLYNKSSQFTIKQPIFFSLHIDMWTDDAHSCFL